MPTQVTDPDLLAQLNAPDRVEVPSSKRVVGDREGVAAGYYEPSPSRRVTDPGILQQLNGSPAGPKTTAGQAVAQRFGQFDVPSNAGQLRQGLNDQAMLADDGRQLISKEVFEGDDRLIRYRDPQTGQLKPVDQKMHDVIRDADGIVKVFARPRAPNEDEFTDTARPPSNTALLPFTRDEQGLRFDPHAGILGSAISGATLPGDVVSGKAKLPSGYGIPGSVPYGDPESAGPRVAETAMFGVGGSPVSRLSPWGGGVGVNRGGVVGGPYGQTPGRLVAQAGERIGVDVPRAAASDSMLVQRGGQVLSNIPLGGSSLRKAGEATTTQLDTAAERAATMPTGARVNPEQGGAAARAGIEEYIGPVTTERSKKLYDAVDSLVDPKVTTSLDNTLAKLNEITGRRANAGQGESAAVKEVLEGATRPGGLNYQGIKDLRSGVGEKMEKGKLLTGDISQKELDQIYGALSEDLRKSVQESGGPRAGAAFERANTYNRLVSDRREALADLLGTRSNEALLSKINQLAGSSGTADAKLLAQARKSMPADEWANIASAVIGDLGRDKAGTFSPALFVRDYGSLSDSGKNILFSSVDKNLRRHLDDIYKVSERAKAWQRFGNPSGSGSVVAGGAQGAAAYGAGQALLAGSAAEPLSFITAVIGTSLLSRSLAKPATAASVAQWSRAYEVAARRPTMASIANLNISSRNLANTVSDTFGVKVNPADFLRSILPAPGPTPIRAEDQQSGM